MHEHDHDHDHDNDHGDHDHKHGDHGHDHEGGVFDIPNYPFEGERPEGAPDSPEFWRLSAAILQLDAVSQEKPGIDVLAQRFGIDLNAAQYMGMQRMMRSMSAMAPLSLDKLLTLARVMWLDGYFAGVVEREGTLK